jgi:hypothetical protein
LGVCHDSGPHEPRPGQLREREDQQGRGDDGTNQPAQNRRS